ncbi:MAG: hypothetical protein P4M05_28015 [Bradyrhizobium sp.]|nr:hypothetical protein [Bradyrhizobium sp.]
MTGTGISNEPQSDGWEWAIVEIFGHRRHAGRTREEERFGAKMLRIDVPVKGNPAANGWETIYYGGSSIFSFALCTEASALQANKPYEPPARYQLSGPNSYDHDDEHDVEESF